MVESVDLLWPVCHQHPSSISIWWPKFHRLKPMKKNVKFEFILFKNGKLSAIFIEQGNSIESFVKWANRDITR